MGSTTSRVFGCVVTSVFFVVAAGYATAFGAVYRASIGEGEIDVHSEWSQTTCDGSTSAVYDYTSFHGAGLLRPSLPLIKQDTQWVAASITETVPSSSGSATYTSTLSAGGSVTTVENSWTEYSDPYPRRSTRTLTETVDLNTGHYTLHLIASNHWGGDCPGETAETQDRTGVLPITLTEVEVPGPVIGDLSPPSGPVGSAVTLRGQRFGASQGSSRVQFGGTGAAVRTWSDTAITVTVPRLAPGTYPVMVTTAAGTSNTVSFAVLDLEITLVRPPQDNRYVIDATPTMPVIRARAKVIGINPPPYANVYWTASLTMRKRTGQKIDYEDDIVQEDTTTGTEVFLLDFIESAAEPKIFRGGTLQLIAKANIGGKTLSGKTPPNLRIEGTNPLRTALQGEIDQQVQEVGLQTLRVADVKDVLKRIACFESGGQRQFRAPANGGIGPVLIAPDNGVGIFQITTTDRCPDPFTVCPEVLFDWRANVAEGVRTYQDKVAIARRYPNRILRRAPAYRRFIEETINPMRKRNGLVPIPPDDLPAPAFTATGRIGATPPNQLLEDAVRGYNGFEGTAYGRALHEFVPNETFLATQPLRRLYTDFRVWRRVPAAERVQSDSDGQYKGDAAYYNHVSRILPHCGGDE